MQRLLFVCFLYSSMNLFAQSIPVGVLGVEDLLRRQQLLGKFDSTFSFNYRPITLGKNGLKADSSIFNANDYFKTIATPLKGRGIIKVLPVEFILAYDHNFPDSRNDGAMIRSKGLQSVLSTGIYAELGPLSVQLKPEIVWAQNLGYEGFPEWTEWWVWDARYVWFDRLDIPERYGTNQYQKLLPGQSSVRLNKWGMSLGISTENIWWGPAKRNSLMMSNNAQGFAHITFNTQRPLKTTIGAFEWQFATGKLDGSSHPVPGHDIAIEGREFYRAKPDDWRYFQGISFSYSPKWISGLSLGFTRWVQQYYQNLKVTKDYFPAFSNLFRKNDNNTTRNEGQRDQAAGVFLRWAWIPSQFEIYFEFAKNDASLNLRDLLVDPDHTRAFVFGFNKLFLDNNQVWELTYEWTHTAQTGSKISRDAWSWYIHANVRHGYTHNGEILGSALGPSGIAHYLEVSKTEGLDRIGGSFERYTHNNDFINFTFKNSPVKEWVDYNFTGFYERKFESVIIGGYLMYSRILNYQWKGNFRAVNVIDPLEHNKLDYNNWNIDLKITYSF